MRDAEFYQREYVEQCKSINQIAKEAGTYSNKIRRELVALGFEIKSRSEVQAEAFSTGQRKPPMKGKHHSFETREKIGKSNHDKAKDPEKIAQLSRQGKESFKKRDKAEFQDAGRAAILLAAKDGSKLEKGLADGLILEGYHVNIHRKNFFDERELELDLFLPKIKVAIEVDGPSHFSEIYGEEKLEKVRERDGRKNAILVQNGCCVIRLRNHTKNTTLAVVKEALDMLIPVLSRLEKEFPPPSKRILVMDLK